MCFGRSLKGDAPIGLPSNSNPAPHVIDKEPAKRNPTAALNRTLVSSNAPISRNPTSAQSPGMSNPDGAPPSYPTTQPSPPTTNPSDPSPPYHDWTSIPDTSLLPPPPSLGHSFSPTANATEESAIRGTAFCNTNPLFAPRTLTPTELSSLSTQQLTLTKPSEYIGDLTLTTPTSYKCRTSTTCPDCSLIPNLPLYLASAFIEPITRATRPPPQTIYFEIHIDSLGQHDAVGESVLALGFVAAPYPTFRLPGWHRASIGVHSDDGRKYVNDPWGGKDFTDSFRVGDAIGLGMSFAASEAPPRYRVDRGEGAAMESGGAPREGSAAGVGDLGALKVEVFFTRNGVKVGGWDVNEELDTQQDGDVVGLRGERDLYPVIGVCGGVDFRVMFGSEGWLYHPR